MKKYYEYFSKTLTNKISKRIKINEYTPEDSESYTNRFEEIKKLKRKLSDFNIFINSDNLYREIIGADLFNTLVETLEKVNEKIQKGFEEGFINSSTIRLFNNLIETFVAEISRKTGQPEKPIKTGFLDYARNRIKIEVALKKIVDAMNHEFNPTAKFVGDLGEKGKLFFKTILVIQNGNITDGELKTVNSVTKTPQKAVSKKLKAILKEVYSDELFKQINDLNSIENGSSITSIKDLLLFKRFFEVNYLPYKPSNGESAMILLHQELSESKDIFLIDEPEKSLGNDYINDFIVPLLKKHAYSGKRVIIATHDANIAVRTLPYNSIYRSHALDCYYTHMGNPFSNSLICNVQDIKSLDWKETSMRTLEGGREAFGERGKIYAEV